MEVHAPGSIAQEPYTGTRTWSWRPSSTKCFY